MSSVERSSSRRDFVRLMLGGFVAPSIVWPFRKYFIPPWLGQEKFSKSWVEWASTYHDQPDTMRIVNAEVPSTYGMNYVQDDGLIGPFRGLERFSFNYFFVGKDGSITQPSPNVTLAQFDGKRLRALRSHNTRMSKNGGG